MQTKPRMSCSNTAFKSSHHYTTSIIPLSTQYSSTTVKEHGILHKPTHHMDVRENPINPIHFLTPSSITIAILPHQPSIHIYEEPSYNSNTKHAIYSLLKLSKQNGLRTLQTHPRLDNARTTSRPAAARQSRARRTDKLLL
jgi:hypothetical protein